MQIREIIYQSLLRISDIIGYNISIYKKSDTPCLTLEDLSRRYPDIIQIGEGTYSSRVYVGIYNPNVKLRIGKYCSIAGDISFILGGNHDKGYVTTYPLTAPIVKMNVDGVEDIVIGNDVWVGHGCTILSGCRISDGVIVGAGSVLPANGYPPYSIIVGNPAKIVGYRFSQEIIEGLLKLKWWDWEKGKIKENAWLLCSENVEELLGVR